MKLYKLKIEGYRRIESAEVLLGDATFLIGPNNAGKSTVLTAIQTMLSGAKRIPETEYYSVLDADTNERKTISNKIILEGEFRDLPAEAGTWRGFKGRIFSYDPLNSGESGLCLTYRKTFDLGKDVIIEIKSKSRNLKDKFEAITTGRDLIALGISQDLVTEIFGDLDKKVTAANKTKQLEEIDEAWDLGSEDVWFQNPGGIAGVVLIRLPKFLLIPADISSNQISGSGVLQDTLTELFEQVRNVSKNYIEAQKFLIELAKELDPQNKDSEFGKMIDELNGVISSVFPESAIHTTTDLSNPDKSIKPIFKVELSSNIKTPVEHQGTGTVRSAVFGILRYRQRWIAKRESGSVKRSIIIGFEEPEIYLHPSAASLMRDTIYDLSGDDSQIVATTHSPFMIDLSRKPRQILNRFSLDNNLIKVSAFNVSEAFISLQENDKSYVKMLLGIDDHLSRIFFVGRIVIVEGDSEDIVIRESIRRLDKVTRQRLISNIAVVKARGKATIVGLVKYLRSMGIVPFVIHDKDTGVEGAEIFNRPISDAAGSENVIQLDKCLEEVLNYPIPKYDKPYQAFKESQKWGSNWSDLPDPWKKIMIKAFEIYEKKS